MMRKQANQIQMVILDIDLLISQYHLLRQIKKICSTLFFIFSLFPEDI